MLRQQGLVLDKQNKLDNETLSKWKAEAVKKRVAVIGGGVAGLSAIKTLFANGIRDVVLLEAQDRLGGRIKTVRYEDSLILEDGAQWIHGSEGNPMFHIAQKLNALKLDNMEDDFLVIREDGTGNDEDQVIALKVIEMLEDAMENGVLRDNYGQGYGQYFIDRFQKEISLGKETPNLKAWLHLMEQMVNSDEGTNDWRDISARDADRYVDYGNDYNQWKNGYDTIITYLMKDIPSSTYLKNTPVSKIYWTFNHDEEKILLVTENESKFLVEAVISTTSVGYLKKHHQHLFHPSLPHEIINNFKMIELGTSNKILVAWSESWWGKGQFRNLVLWTKFNLPKEMQWLYGIVEIFQLSPNEPTLGAFVTGKYSCQMETLDEETVQQHFLTFLKTLHDKVEIPEPKVFRRTSWNTNPWTCGSYSSYITLEGEKNGIFSRAPFRRPLINARNNSVLFWAGEHTHDTRPGTTDGALSSGRREAIRISKLFSKDNLSH